MGFYVGNGFYCNYKLIYVKKFLFNLLFEQNYFLILNRSSRKAVHDYEVLALLEISRVHLLKLKWLIMSHEMILKLKWSITKISFKILKKILESKIWNILFQIQIK